ncbi:16S rRNA (cytosine(1402)-N(4))-methyltransferase RsmH [Candidatus Nomurabacteria bacterium]|nr:16S rRNA (cytosine(1402)-N(4))-methyltransferase RsmH [Candidatus Nomurabacteria bacterium]
MKDNFQHQTVLLEEVVKGLEIKANQNFIDGTLGGGGHTEKILEKNGPRGKVLAFELDQRAIKASQKRLNKYQKRLFIVNQSYIHLAEEWQKKQKEIGEIAGIVLDLGLSSDQLDSSGRGFSFKDQGPLDMRFDPKHQTLTAEDIILTWSESELCKIFREYGEEPKAHILAQGLIKNRSSWIKQKQKFTTSMFVLTILRILNIKETSLGRFRIHPATKVFQALRIAVNDELNNVKTVLPQAVDILPSGGKIAVISFHSLEDKIVKYFFKESSQTCVCPPQAPICNCDTEAKLKIITKKAIKPSSEEVKNNPRSRSAILRIAEKI